jgi:long-chain acyl-CoA synthetase
LGQALAAETPLAADARGAMPPTVAAVLDRGLECCPDKRAVVGRNRTYSYQGLDHAANRSAAALREQGVKAGDRLAVCLPNDADIVALFHGAMRLGLIWVGINAALSVPEKLALLADCDAAMVACSDAVARDLDAAQATTCPRLMIVDPGPSGESWRQSMAAASGEFAAVRVDRHAAAAIAYTSGSSGRPKGVVHSQYNMLLPGAVVCESRGYGPDLVKGDFLPLTILNLMILGPLLTAQACGTFVAIDRRDATGILHWLEDENVTVWNGVPPVLYDMARDAEITPERLSGLKDIWSGGADCPEVLRDAFERKFCLRVHATYGLTEAPTLVAIEEIGSAHIPGASGAALPHLSVAAVDDDGNTLPPGKTGEFLVGPVTKGPWRGAYKPMLGYWNSPAETAAAISGGQLRTGDLGHVDDHGQLHVRDRRSSMINRGGANIYPAEVESVILQLQGVSAVAVIGLPDARLGQRVAAVVEQVGVAVTAEQVQAYCQEQLARYKVPEQVRIVPALPRNAMGKIRRTELSALFG